jgi:uncharacterized protein involved in tolerance to divalent cations
MIGVTLKRTGIFPDYFSWYTKAEIAGEFILCLKTLKKKTRTVFRRIKDSLSLKLPEAITKQWRRGLTKSLLI